MKKFSKVFINILAVIMVILSCFSLTACKEDIKKVIVNISVYNYTEDDDTTPGFETVSIEVDMYRHLAPNTVDTIMGYINEGYYDNTVFYQIDGSLTRQMMLGDYKLNGVSPVANAIKPQIEGEFEHGGTTGSNLKVKKGAIGLWRTWTAFESKYNQHNETLHSGRSNWFLPTNVSESTLNGYNGYFCIFAQIDLSSSANSNAFTLITEALNKNTTNYVVYYTGEYDTTKEDENFGLTQHIVLEEDFVDSDDVFVATKEQRECYNKHTIKIPTLADDGAITAKVTSIVVK